MTAFLLSASLHYLSRDVLHEMIVQERSGYSSSIGKINGVRLIVASSFQTDLIYVFSVSFPNKRRSYEGYD